MNKVNLYERGNFEFVKDDRIKVILMDMYKMAEKYSLWKWLETEVVLDTSITNFLEKPPCVEIRQKAYHLSDGEIYYGLLKMNYIATKGWDTFVQHFPMC